MAQAFNHFVRFLMEHEDQYDPSLPRRMSWGCALFLAVPFVLQTSLPLGLGLILLGFLLMFVPLWIAQYRTKKALLQPPAELDEAMALLRWIGMRGELNRRTHPELRELLEEIASIRRTTLDALESESWKARAKTADGAKAVQDIETVLKDALYDAIFIGRHMLRAKGQREATFYKRCNDPEFGRHSLLSISQIRDEMRLLSESALAAGAKSDLRVNLIKTRLDALVEAEREMEEVSSFDATD